MFDHMNSVPGAHEQEGFTLMPLLGVPDVALDIARSVDVDAMSSVDVRRAIGELRVWQGVGAALEARLREHAAREPRSASADFSDRPPWRLQPRRGGGGDVPNGVRQRSLASAWRRGLPCATFPLNAAA